MDSHWDSRAVWPSEVFCAETGVFANAAQAGATVCTLVLGTDIHFRFTVCARVTSLAGACVLQILSGTVAMVTGVGGTGIGANFALLACPLGRAGAVEEVEEILTDATVKAWVGVTHLPTCAPAVKWCSGCYVELLLLGLWQPDVGWTVIRQHYSTNLYVTQAANQVPTWLGAQAP